MEKRAEKVGGVPMRENGSENALKADVLGPEGSTRHTMEQSSHLVDAVKRRWTRPIAARLRTVWFVAKRRWLTR
jgi:hypothetical protein